MATLEGATPTSDRNEASLRRSERYRIMSNREAGASLFINALQRVVRSVNYWAAATCHGKVGGVSPGTYMAGADRRIFANATIHEKARSVCALSVTWFVSQAPTLRQ